MCSDDQVAKVSRVTPFVETSAFPRRKSKRRLKSTVSETRATRKVDVLVAALVELECQRMTGEDQTLCIMSDSFNSLGGQSVLQESGDLAHDGFPTVVEELPTNFAEGGRMPTDEGSAMTELAYDIAEGANFKFNTMIMGTLVAANDIIKLYTGQDEGGEACDVIVDGITYLGEQAFRDGVISSRWTRPEVPAPCTSPPLATAATATSSHLTKSASLISTQDRLWSLAKALVSHHMSSILKPRVMTGAIAP